MKPWNRLATAPTADGTELVLQERDGVYVIRIGGQELMSSARHGSEDAMAEVGLRSLKSDAPSVLLGGLGLGYTLRAVLDRLPIRGSVVLVELSRAVVDWNLGPLAKLAGEPLVDRRVTVEVADVGQFVALTQRRFDAILLDVDNGPIALFQKGNQSLYSRAGLVRLRSALRAPGVLVVWSAGPDPRFLQELRRAGFDAEEHRVAARKEGGGTRHVLFLGKLSPSK